MTRNQIIELLENKVYTHNGNQYVLSFNITGDFDFCNVELIMEGTVTSDKDIKYIKDNYIADKWEIDVTNIWNIWDNTYNYRTLNEIISYALKIFDKFDLMKEKINRERKDIEEFQEWSGEI